MTDRTSDRPSLPVLDNAKAAERRALFEAGVRLHRILGPWTECQGGWLRKKVEGHYLVALSHDPYFMGNVMYTFAGRRPELKSGRILGNMDEAKAHVDQILTEAGWELVD